MLTSASGHMFTRNSAAYVISVIAGSKKRVALEDNAPAIPKKRHTVKTKPSPSQASLDIVNVTQDVVPLQIIDPTPAAAAVNSPVPKKKSRKRRLFFPTGSDDETMGTQELAKDTDVAAVKPTDEVDIIIEQVLEENLKLGVNEEEHGGQGVDEAMFADDFAREAAGSKSPVVVKDMNRAVSSMFTNEEHMSIDDLLLQISDDMLLPSITATEITKIRLGESISITEVREHDVYLASLPAYPFMIKGKAILEEDEPKLMLEWAETDLLAMAVKRKEYILAKYRELFLRKFLDSHRKYIAPGQSWTATASQIIDLLSDSHSISLEYLLAQQREHGLPMEQPCASTVFDSSVDSGAVLARFYSAEKSTCWRRNYYVQIPVSPPAISLHQESSSSSTDVSMHFNSEDISLNARTDTQPSAPVYFTVFTDALEDLRLYVSQRIHDSNCEILSKINSVEIGVREALLKQNDLNRQSLQNARLDHETQGFTPVMHINDLKKGMLAQVGPVFQDLMDIKRSLREQDAKITALDRQVAAIRNEQLDFQSKIAADLLSLSTQFGEIVDYIRGGDAKKGKGSSSRPPNSLPGSSSRPLQPPPADQIRDSGHVANLEELEEAAERIREADRRERERDRQRRERRLSRSGAFKRRRGY
ncbi:hypothetical protein F511_40064 [Dorcoceras hygrometricum]|uniref:Uncharacterized protein n=1 Tax=Dorcoceras hygrometricum TaxID=472368 RepID=A0A2Z7DC31_9LAMI|nr:hypothetical protein F511_40064 [Dorcoceras hygrometricum]